MIKKVHYTWKDVEHMIQTINNLMYVDNWRPDYIVGMTRGGLVPAVIMSNMTGITMHALDVRFRDVSDDYIGPESNCWMAEQAYGYDKEQGWSVDMGQFKQDENLVKNILVFDDINDTGRTFQWIKEDWQSGCLPDSPLWDYIWHNNVRFASLVDNAGSQFQECDYTAIEIDKREDDAWLVFPWEGERNYGNT